MTTATLPALTGSDKQIAWATELREKAMPVMRGAAEKAATMKPAAVHIIESFIETIEREVRASWWIDNQMLANREAYSMAPAFRAVTEAVRKL